MCALRLKGFQDRKSLALAPGPLRRGVRHPPAALGPGLGWSHLGPRKQGWIFLIFFSSVTPWPGMGSWSFLSRAGWETSQVRSDLSHPLLQ